MDKNMRFKFAVDILPNITEKMELAGYDDRDIMALKAIAFHSGVNENNAIILKDDAIRSVNTLIGKPLRILFDGLNPTGHGYNRQTNKFSKAVTNIGFIHWAYIDIDENNPDEYNVIVEVAVWRKYFPEITNRMRELHQAGELFFSIESEREFEITPEGYRRCFNILFNGLAVVQSPAWTESKSLMVAEILKEGGKSNMDEIMKLLEGLKDTLSTEVAEQFKSNLGVLNDKIADLTGKLETAETERDNAKEELATANGTIKELEVDRDKFKEIIETAEKEKNGNERLEKLSKYGKVEKTATELAEMDKESFVTLLEEMVTNYQPQENADDEDAIGVKFEKINKNSSDRKAKLLGFVEKLS